MAYTWLIDELISGRNRTCGPLIPVQRSNQLPSQTSCPPPRRPAPTPVSIR